MIGVINEGSVKAFCAGFARTWVVVLISSAIMLVINICFTLSLLKVDAAKALLIISLNPLWSAILGVVILGDKLPLRTIVTQAVSLVAMVLVV